jgi:hypothetical protein
MFLLLLWASAAAGAAERYTEHTLRLAEGETSPPAGIETMAWLAGTWAAPAFGGVGEETWLPAEGGAMAGVFRHRGDDGATFYEILVIREVEGSLLLQLRHFDPALVGWEEREETVDFPLVAADFPQVDFEGMRFVSTGPERMTVFLAVDDGEVRFDYERY